MSEDLVNLAQRWPERAATHYDGCEADHVGCLVKKLAQEVERLKADVEERDKARAEVERLTAERDEARAEVECLTASRNAARIKAEGRLGDIQLLAAEIEFLARPYDWQTKRQPWGPR